MSTEVENTESSLARIMKEREAKARQLAYLGHSPYANTFKPTTTTKEFRALYAESSRDELSQLYTLYHIAGRVMAIRNMGKVAFARIQDRDGDIQVFLQQNRLGDGFDLLKYVDVGDVIGVVGTPMRTKTDELTIAADSIAVLTKSLRPLPEKWHGLINVEQRYRHRYLDLIVNAEARQIFRTRSKVIREIQNFLDERGFIEVETPILADIAGGATAKPFLTHHNALNENLSLRIATELHLKRLLVGGFERVYEIGRIFRNEGVSTKHNPEFTSIEFYHAYATYIDLMDLSEAMLRHVVMSVHGKLEIPYQEHTLDFGKPFRRVSVACLVAESLGLDPLELEAISDIKTALELAKMHAPSMEDILSICLSELTDEELLSWFGGKVTSFDKLSEVLQVKLADEKVRSRRLALHLLYAIFEHRVESTLTQPTFVTDYSVSVSPLARRRDGDAAMVDRFELFCAGMEVSDAFSELNDPLDQRERFMTQMRKKSRGDEEAHVLDEDFLRALEVGMPPAAGQGIGIDRLVMLLTNSASIREVILFPKMRVEK